ncbi:MULTISPECIES: glycosyltransferase family 2 protein [unclassified Streptomyces]|uniref:glycosyltransferase family 2 protein n=1 Tax=unclassified Streptomyces TaxID=2593676 RepID=UPI0006FE4C75|nr:MULTISPECIES: glycosyltransferase family 2 protein [unclassified Streptomyces]KQX49848.1 histidinol phosphate phosphatase [Streptomyces sp. Root1304]KRA80109.1 histidinol phosphate phosphatase [Streptomyces sp. Root66D1]
MSSDSHPLRRSTDRSPDPGTRTVSLVLTVRPEVRDPGAVLAPLLGQLPSSVGDVVLVGAPAGDGGGRGGFREGLTVRGLGPWDAGRGDIPHAGLRAATGEFVVLMDADGSMSPHEIPHFLHYLESGYDFVKGSRFIAGGDFADYPLSRRLGHRALLRVARQLYGQHLTDLWYGFCAFRRTFVDLLDLREDGVELGAELVAHALHYGLRVAEVPSLELPHRHGPSHPRTVRDGARILGTLLDERPHNALSRLAHRRPGRAARGPGTSSG